MQTSGQLSPLARGKIVEWMSRDELATLNEMLRAGGLPGAFGTSGWREDESPPPRDDPEARAEAVRRKALRIIEHARSRRDSEPF